MTADEVVEWVDDHRGGKHFVANHNLHSVHLHKTLASFRRAYDLADLVVVDGSPVLWLTRRRRPELGHEYRTGSTDWIARLGDSMSPGELCLVGASAESNRRAVERLTADLGPKGWRVRGIDGFRDNAETLDWLRGGVPTLVLVGMGMPRQEEFLLENWEKLPPAVYATVGGAIDYVAGTTNLAPRWMGRLGVEWLWRLAHEPRRLAARYLVEPLALAWLIVVRRR
ncbi:WecB/TagA/CpsF family glycosyltransferase [Protaetiibacter sp. SSC-01]|uniref:WecB/TagA/CpsF family glycosyltransferase n=1 Tax=Protaetiibacter sp. SSC-01 TaxID=2759943 RepID=UPI001656BA5E|nr:WecB/TagA/CpsF family glycosyltransferase [Protaetiibacter sp. SSC-01]QNO38096.1 WecB/TagA/CpsF family glycosyltransferase [Protaetiibacter sp. SSC-01]